MAENENPEGGAANAPPAESAEEQLRKLQAELAQARAANQSLQDKLERLEASATAAPAAAPEVPAPPSPARPQAPPRQMSGVLIVDDSKIMRMSLSRIIASFGYKVAGEADSGEFGADMAITLQPAVVILDHSLPGMSGLECAAIIRERSPGTRIIVLTSTMDQATGVNYAAMGITDILAKPAQTELLLKALVKHLGPPPSGVG